MSWHPADANMAWTVGWLVWLGVFVTLEVPPLLRGRQQDTLSSHVRTWFGLSQRPSGKQLRARRVALVAGLSWVTVHLLAES